MTARVFWPFPSPLGTWVEAVGLGRFRRSRYVIGSVLLLRGEALEHVGGFDERFFLYAEETDWARPSHDARMAACRGRGARAHHVGAAMSTDPSVRESHFHASQELFLRKHHGVAGWQVSRAGQLAGSAVRAVALRGEARKAARDRLRLYLAGPARTEPRPATRAPAARARRLWHGGHDARRPRGVARARPRCCGGGLGLGATGLLLAVGWLAVVQPTAAVAVALGVVAVGVTAVQPAAIPLAALPLLLAAVRVGGGGLNLSVSDVALTIAAVVAVLLAPRPLAPGLRAVLWAAVGYQFATLATVVNNPYAANALEWAHAGTLVIGALFVGWIVGARGYGRLGMRLIILTIALLAVITIVEGVIRYASGDFAPVYPSFPYVMHKNFVGTLCAIGAGMMYTRPVWVGFSRVAMVVLTTLMIVAMLLTQSRQAVIGLVAAVFVIVFRSDAERRRSKLVLLLAVPLVAFVTNLVQDQVISGNRFNSVFQRITWFQDSIAVWQADPWFGVGLRWWYTDRFPVRFQPPNAEIEVLTTAGVVGLVAFVALVVVALGVAWKLDPAYGSVALAVLVNRFAQAQFDLFWAAVQGSLPFVVLGLCLGAEAHARSREQRQSRTALGGPDTPARSVPAGVA